MAVNRVPVLKRCRSLDLDPTFLGYDKKSNRTSARAGKKISEYGLQLREKQKAKFIYGVLESRLDSVVFRMGFARTRREARQVVGHKHFLVNGKPVQIPSYLLKAGDVVEVREKAKSLQRYKDILEVTGGRLVPEWLEVDQEAMKATVKYLPTREMIDVPVNEMLIVELYSK